MKGEHFTYTLKFAGGEISVGCTLPEIVDLKACALLSYTDRHGMRQHTPLSNVHISAEDMANNKSIPVLTPG